MCKVSTKQQLEEDNNRSVEDVSLAKVEVQETETEGGVKLKDKNHHQQQSKHKSENFL